MCHEIGHMYGIHHCVFFECLMNGSNHLQEADTGPSFSLPCVSQQAVLRDEVWHWGEIPQDGRVLEVSQSYGGGGMAGETANHCSGGYVACMMTYSHFLFPFYTSIISCPVSNFCFCSRMIERKICAFWQSLKFTDWWLKQKGQK